MVSEHSVACRIETLGLETLRTKSIFKKNCKNITFYTCLFIYSVLVSSHLVLTLPLSLLKTVDVCLRYVVDERV